VIFTVTAYKYSKTSPTKELAVATRQCTISHFLFHLGISNQNAARPSSPVHLTWPPATSPRFLNWRYRHFDTTEVTEAELQAVPSTLTDHYFLDAFQNGKSTGNSAHVLKDTTSMLMVASRPKVSFWSDGSTNIRNYG
jgi:hypothetical protein